MSEALSKDTQRDMIISLEQKYINMFSKDQLYNFLFVAGSRLGAKHSEESKKLMSFNSKGKNIGKNIGKSPINKGKTLSESERLKLKLASIHRYKPVYFYDEMTNLICVYESMNDSVD